MERGTRLHADCENYVKGNLMVVPWELKKVALRLEDLKQKKAAAEETWLLDRNWKHDEKEPWIKAIIDVHWFEPGRKVIHVTDYKSGREYPEHMSQLELYGLMALCRFPETHRVEFEALYLDGGYTSNHGAILRGDIMENKIKKWNERAIRIFEDKEHRPNPGGACRFCDYNHKVGGPCSAGV